MLVAFPPRTYIPRQVTERYNANIACSVQHTILSLQSDCYASLTCALLSHWRRCYDVKQLPHLNGLVSLDTMVATTSAAKMAVSPRPAIEDMRSPVIPDEEGSPLDDGDGEEPLDIDQDDVQSFIQPALSPVATRLTLPKTPAAEKAAAMDQVSGGGLFDVMESFLAGKLPSPPPPRPRTSGVVAPTPLHRKGQQRGFTISQIPSNLPYVSKFPSPWVSGPKELVVDNDSGSKSAMAGVFGLNRNQRASSGGQDPYEEHRVRCQGFSCLG